MGNDESLSTLKSILEEQQKSNVLLERLVGLMSGGNDQYDPQIMEAVFLLTSQPKSVMYGGKIAAKRVAKKVGCDVRKLKTSDTFMKSLERIEGGPRKAKKGHVTVSGDGVQVDASSEIDWTSVIEKMDAGENVDGDIDNLIGD